MYKSSDDCMQRIRLQVSRRCAQMSDFGCPAGHQQDPCPANQGAQAAGPENCGSSSCGQAGPQAYTGRLKVL